ncbi:MAG: hypothetical protein EOO39_22840 [Cytophagaceae bacterium]|nr:MAG: hypothetical protein EOO39_22840 [Cytophagaceae bacterium]
MEPTIDYTTVPGWGVDADDRNDPTYPMKNYTGDDHRRSDYERPTMQPVPAGALHSNERPDMTAVFGTDVSPSGISGQMRRFAFRYSENHYFHWLILMAADRVNVVEGVVRDLAHGRIPNIFAEKGYKAEWKHDPAGLIIKLATAAAIVGGAVVLLSSKSGKKAKRSAS